MRREAPSATAFVSGLPLGKGVLHASPVRVAGKSEAASVPHRVSVLRSARASLEPLASPLQSTIATALVTAPLQLAEVSEVNYNSLAVTAFVFFLAFWGSVSFLKGSVKTRITQASFSLPVSAPDVAQRVSKYLTERGFTPDTNKDPRPGVITFEGTVKSSSSVAFILVLVAGSGLWAASLIANVLLPEALRNGNYGWLSLASLAVVPWYKGQAERIEEVKVMVEEEDAGDETKSVLFVKGHRDEISTMEEALGWVRNDPDGEEAQKVVASAIAKVGNAQ